MGCRSPSCWRTAELRYIPTLSQLRTRGHAAQLDNMWIRVPFIETIEEFRFAARCLHDVYWAWRIFNEGLDPSDITWQSADVGFGTLGLASTLLTNVLTRLGGLGPQIQGRLSDAGSGPFQSLGATT